MLALSASTFGLSPGPPSILFLPTSVPGQCSMPQAESQAGDTRMGQTSRRSGDFVPVGVWTVLVL